MKKKMLVSEKFDLLRMCKRLGGRKLREILLVEGVTNEHTLCNELRYLLSEAFEAKDENFIVSVHASCPASLEGVNLSRYVWGIYLNVLIPKLRNRLDEAIANRDEVAANLVFVHAPDESDIKKEARVISQQIQLENKQKSLLKAIENGCWEVALSIFNDAYSIQPQTLRNASWEVYVTLLNAELCERLKEGEKNKDKDAVLAVFDDVPDGFCIKMDAWRAYEELRDVRLIEKLETAIAAEDKVAVYLVYADAQRGSFIRKKALKAIASFYKK